MSWYGFVSAALGSVSLFYGLLCYVMLLLLSMVISLCVMLTYMNLVFVRLIWC
jgi:hypothetical protein